MASERKAFCGQRRKERLRQAWQENWEEKRKEDESEDVGGKAECSMKYESCGLEGKSKKSYVCGYHVPI